MLKELNVDQARFVALLARVAREARDAMLGHGSGRHLDGPTAARGERDGIVSLGYDPLPADDHQLAALCAAVGTLTPSARSELYVLMRIGQGHLAADKWHRGLIEAQSLGDATVVGVLTEDPDLHDHLAKGLYEARLGS